MSVVSSVINVPTVPLKIDGKLLMQKGGGPKPITMRERQSEEILAIQGRTSCCGIYYTGRASQGTWALSKHRLDYPQGQPQRFRHFRKYD